MDTINESGRKVRMTVEQWKYDQRLTRERAEMSDELFRDAFTTSNGDLAVSAKHTYIAMTRKELHMVHLLVKGFRDEFSSQLDAFNQSQYVNPDARKFLQESHDLAKGFERRLDDFSDLMDHLMGIGGKHLQAAQAAEKRGAA